jgi:SpoVK/Ycf46/Vps4 family AAA+-type ATPase
LARAVAGQLGWRFIELHSSHFVSEGLGGVQRVADRIFGSLMQLDHAVVLFDEVDELVRVRDVGTDQFGRFLTTSMLPRLAELWKRRKLIYFINTNYIEYFDSAITRSERFDALIFVAPPSFEAKRDKLRGLIEEISGAPVASFDVNQQDIENAFAAICNRSNDEAKTVVLAESEVLAQFKLIRWDQLREVAEALLNEGSQGIRITSDTLGAALNTIRDAELKKPSSYNRFANDAEYARRDFERLPVYEIDLARSDPGLQGLIEENGRNWLRGTFAGIQRRYSVERVGGDWKLGLHLAKD